MLYDVLVTPSYLLVLPLGCTYVSIKGSSKFFCDYLIDVQLEQRIRYTESTVQQLILMLSFFPCGLCISSLFSHMAEIGSLKIQYLHWTRHQSITL